MFKIEKCILNYACFKHPWLVEVMSMLVDINEKIVLSLWSPGRCFLNFRAAIFKNTFFPEHLQWVLSRIAWTLITAEKFNNLFITKMLTPQNCVYVCVCVCVCVCVGGGGIGGGGWVGVPAASPFPTPLNTPQMVYSSLRQIHCRWIRASMKF